MKLNGTTDRGLDLARWESWLRHLLADSLQDSVSLTFFIFKEVNKTESIAQDLLWGLNEMMTGSNLTASSGPPRKLGKRYGQTCTF